MTERETTESLVQRAQAGEPGAFAELSALYEARLTALAASRMAPSLRRKLGVEDVVQETFTRALESIARFRWSGEGSFLRWLGGIARNIIARAARDLGVGADLELHPETPGSDTSLSRRARRGERFDRLEAALLQLTPDQREALRLSRIDGLKVREIAERLDKSPDAVQQLIVRGLKSLRRNFGDTQSLHLPDRALDFGTSDSTDEGGAE